MTPLCCIVIVTARELIAVPFGDKWHGATIPLQILAPVTVLSVYTLGDALLKSTNHLKTQLFAHAVFCILLVTSVFCFARFGFGINGVAVGVLISNVVMYAYMACVCARILKSSWLELVNSHFPAVCMGVTVLGVGWTTRMAVNYMHPPMWVAWIVITMACLTAFLMLSLVPIGGPMRDYQILFGQYVDTMYRKNRYAKRIAQHLGLPHANP
jgi:O-antigen/teichoic acid export membrane protein